MESELKQRVKALICANASKYTTPQEFFDHHIHFFRPISPVPYDIGTKHSRLDLVIEDVEAINRCIDQIPLIKWTQSELREKSTQVILNLLKAKYPDFDLQKDVTGMKKVSAGVNYYLRWAVTGGRPGPGITFTMELLGRDVTMQRLEEARDRFKLVQGQEKSLDEDSHATNGTVR